MKKLSIYGTMALATVMVIFACQKKEINQSGQTTVQNQQTNSNLLRAAASGTVKTVKRSYKWVGNVLDCSADGSGCEVAAKLIMPNETIDLATEQVLKLMDIGRYDLNNYFLKNQNELRNIFPELYQGNFPGQIATGKLNLVFQFPYFFVYNDKGTSQTNLVEVFNYESTLSNQDVISALRLAAAGGATKKAELNTDTNNPVVWKCISAGDNCKTTAATAFTFYPEWIESNPQYLFLSTVNPISKATLTKYRDQLEITTTTNNLYVVDLK